MAFLDASGVKILDALKDPIRNVNKGAQANLQKALGGIGARQNKSNTASGRVMGSYAPAELSRAGTNASLGIEDALASALGESSYSELQKQQEHQRNIELATLIAKQNKPNALMEALGALGSAAQTGASLYGGFKGAPEVSAGSNPTYGSLNMTGFGAANPSYQNLNYPSIPNFGLSRRSSYGF